MALRRACWEDLRGFDEFFGLGARLRAAEEGDVAIRALERGWAVAQAPEVHVVHHGFRDWSAGAGVIEGYWFGAGAARTKALRMRWSTGLWGLAALLGRWVFEPSPVASSIGPRLRRFQQFRAFVAGSLTALALPLDRDSGHFRPTADRGSLARGEPAHHPAVGCDPR